MEIPKVYAPKEIEEKIYKSWEEKKYFESHINPELKPFTIVIPPPNVTGALHIGHALNNTLQDVIIRYRRMKGYNALWVPGTDHGGIATQNVVEKMLLKEGTDRHKLGREKFLQRMWKWKNESGDTILHQLRKLGCSCDWSRTRFTMDEICSKAVITAFVKLYKKGLIYRGKRMVNWCPRCNTALADIEVEHREEKSHLWYIKYPLLDRSPAQPLNRFIVVATTRPETMLGDTAVAVNPKDERYKHLIGKTVHLPLTERKIPVISDDLVDMTFGTGAVKVTPAHDPVDYEIAQKHSLSAVTVIDKEGKMLPEAGKKYSGLDRYECRKIVIKDLESQNLLEKIEDYTHSVGTCYRCHTVIEPLISEQWFLNTKEMAERGLKSIKEGKVKFYPQTWKEPAINWLENLKDWCLSRQIWWGHRIPVWYCENSCEPIASEKTPEKCPKCGSKNLKQDPDVLDTWFSSALWPFSVFGWPDESEDLKYYYPTSVLVTGYEILYLWVARMIMMGLEFMNEVPFTEVYIHGIVRDIHGKKMSKSLGNVIDPLVIMEQYGTDALRFALTQSATAGRDIQLSEDSFVGARNFANKIWNASRFVMMNLGNSKVHNFKSTANNLQPMDKWIYTKYNQLLKKIDSAFQSYSLSEYARLIYQFFWFEFCDWYLELVKTRQDKETVNAVLHEILVGCLKLLHPVMPYITEEIYQKIGAGESIMISPWPEIEKEKIFSEEEISEVEFIIKLIQEIRKIKTELNIPVKSLISIGVKSSENEFEKIKKYLPNLNLMCKVGEIKKVDKKPEHSSLTIIEGIEIYVLLEGLIDFEKEKNRLQKEIEKINEGIKHLEEKLNDSKFLKFAPEKEVERLKTIFNENNIKLARLQKYIEEISK